MKNIIYMIAALIFGTAMAQENPTEVKQETEIKTVKYKAGEKTNESKVKVITRETANVKLDKNDKNKVNQDRLNSTKKVEKMVMIDDDSDADYETLTKITFYVVGVDKYMFTPNNRGFDIAFNNEDKKFVKSQRALTTGTRGNYIIRGEVHHGIGYFDVDGNFVVEYYNADTDHIEVKTYNRMKTDM